MRRSILALLVVLLVPGTARAALDPVVETKNYAKTSERQALYDSPAGRLLLQEVSRRNLTAALQAQANDPEREFVTDVCWNGGDGCAGDARLYAWPGLVAYGQVRIRLGRACPPREGRSQRSAGEPFRSR